MSRLTERLQAARLAGRKAFIPYLTAGDPDLAFTRECVKLLARAGADAIELGVPFSDPVADGPANLLSAGRALAAGITPAHVLELARGIRADGIDLPLVLFTYLNPILRNGLAEYLKEARRAGFDASLIVDLPPEESAAYLAAARDAALDPIFLASPTTPSARAKEICEASRGFVYYVSRAGVTGVQSSVSASLPAELQRLRALTSLPICVGFGISTPEQAREAARHADGAIVGSAFVRLLDSAARDRAGALRQIETLALSISSSLKETSSCSS